MIRIYGKHVSTMQLRAQTAIHFYGMEVPSVLRIENTADPLAHHVNEKDREEGFH